MDFMQLLGVILHVDKALGTIISQYGTWVYGVLFAIIFCETGLVVAPFLPGDSLLFIAGAFCATGAMHLELLIILLIIAAVTGDNLNYLSGGKSGGLFSPGITGGSTRKLCIILMSFLKNMAVKPSLCAVLSLWYVHSLHLWPV